MSSSTVTARHPVRLRYTAHSECNITVYHGSAYTVVRATSSAYGEWQNWGRQNSETPEPINIKFDMGDYVGNISLHAKIQSNRPSGSVPAHR